VLKTFEVFFLPGKIRTDIIKTIGITDALEIALNVEIIND